MDEDRRTLHEERTDLLQAENFLESLKANRHVPPRLGEFEGLLGAGEWRCFCSSWLEIGRVYDLGHEKWFLAGFTEFRLRGVE